MKKFKKMKKMPLFAFPHKAWGGGGFTMRHLVLSNQPLQNTKFQKILHDKFFEKNLKTFEQ